MLNIVPFAVLQEAVRVLRCEVGPANSVVAGAAASYLLVYAYSAPHAAVCCIVLAHLHFMRYDGERESAEGRRAAVPVAVWTGAGAGLLHAAGDYIDAAAWIRRTLVRLDLLDDTGACCSAQLVRCLLDFPLLIVTAESWCRAAAANGTQPRRAAAGHECRPGLAALAAHPSADRRGVGALPGTQARAAAAAVRFCTTSSTYGLSTTPSAFQCVHMLQNFERGMQGQCGTGGRPACGAGERARLWQPGGFPWRFTERGSLERLSQTLETWRALM